MLTDVEELRKELATVNEQIAAQDIKVAKTKANNTVKASRERTKLRDLEIQAGKLREQINKQLLVDQSRSIMAKFDAIADKNDCLRVRFYDWLATKFEKWATSLRDRAFRISKPCAVKLPKKKEQTLKEKYSDWPIWLIGKK